jgi:5-methylcytosine-specific restriction endonuclease McrA
LQITLDHVIPLTRGGAHTASNLRVACRSCNSSKGELMPDEYAAKMALTKR